MASCHDDEPAKLCLYDVGRSIDVNVWNVFLLPSPESADNVLLRLDRNGFDLAVVVEDVEVDGLYDDDSEAGQRARAGQSWVRRRTGSNPHGESHAVMRR